MYGGALESHGLVVIARRYLESKGIVAKDYLDLYTQMFALGFARVSQDGNQFHIERQDGLSKAQLAYADDMRLNKFEVFVNDQRYTESKARNGVSTLSEQIAGR